MRVLATNGSISKLMKFKSCTGNQFVGLPRLFPRINSFSTASTNLSQDKFSPLISGTIPNPKSDKERLKKPEGSIRALAIFCSGLAFWTFGQRDRKVEAAYQGENRTLTFVF